VEAACPVAEQDRDLLRLTVAAREVRLSVLVEICDRDVLPAMAAGHGKRRPGSRREAARAVAEEDRERVPMVCARRPDQVVLAVPVQVGGDEPEASGRYRGAGREAEAPHAVPEQHLDRLRGGDGEIHPAVSVEIRRRAGVRLVLHVDGAGRGAKGTGSVA